MGEIGKEIERQGYGVEHCVDIEIQKNHDRTSEEESHKQMLTPGGQLTRGSVENPNR